MIEELQKGKQKFKKEDKICLSCGHYDFLHNFRDECDACDDPTIKMEKKCTGLKIKE